MAVVSKASRASGSPVSPLRKSPDERWAKAKEIASLLGLSEGAVYRGEAGTDAIRSAYLPGTEHKARPSRRFYFPDALAIYERMLKAAAPKPQAIPDSILRLLPPRRRRQER